MSQILQMSVKWRHKHEKRKHIKCNKITQAYRSRCITEIHQVRPESLKTLRIVQQGEVSLPRVAYFWKRGFSISFCRAAHFSTTTHETSQPRIKKNVDSCCISLCRYSAKRQVKTLQEDIDSKLCQLQLSVNKSQMLHKFSTWILFASASVNSYSMPFSSFSLPSLFLQAKVWIQSAIVCCHNNFFETVY